MLSVNGSGAHADDQDRARELLRAGTIVPLEQITAHVRDSGFRHVLEVELESEDDTFHYEVEVLDDDGVVRKLLYDATTGQPLSTREDR